jgi:serine/threonine protein kinase
MKQTETSSELIEGSSSSPISKELTTEQLSSFIMVSKIGNGKFPVFLAKKKSDNTRFAMKVFPFFNGNPNPHFENELKFSELSSNKILTPKYYKTEHIIKYGGKVQKASFLLMEFAPNGDLFSAIIERGIQFNDILIRTYFLQLLDGVEYLHSKGISHMDLKPENLVLDDNFNLRIIDFDGSMKSEEKNTFGLGTKYYRAPEIINGTIRDYFSADIYSLGIILFVMKSGGLMPHTEHDMFRGCDLMSLME